MPECHVLGVGIPETCWDVDVRAKEVQRAGEGFAYQLMLVVVVSEDVVVRDSEFEDLS